MRYLYGPVPSRRLGASLGIDLVPYKTCSYDCIYCQCGRTTNKTIRREEYIPIPQIINEVKDFLARYQGRLDYLTLSGAGEPTLNSGLGEVIQQLKRLSNKPVAVLTNGSLLSQADVQESLMAADVVLPSLNTALPQTFRAVHRPAAIKFETVIDGLIQFRHLFKKEIWLEVFLLRVYNDDAENLEALKQAIQRVQPDKVQLNTVTRPPAEDFAYHLSSEEMNQVCKLFGPGTEVIAERELIIPQTTIGMDDRSRILSLLTRRPCKLPEITNSLGLEEAKVFKYIAELENEGKIRYTVIKEQIYYHLRAEARKTLSS